QPLIGIGAASIAGTFAYFQFAANAANTRAGVAAVFESEILSICHVIETFSIIEALQEVDLEGDPEAWKLLKQRMATRSENYMEAFTRNVDKLANLPNKAVEETTAFYTFLKASRDATSVLGTWEEDTPLTYKERDVLKIIIQLKHCLGHAQRAVKELSD